MITIMTSWNELGGFVISLISLVATIAIFVITLIINCKINKKSKDWKKDLNNLITELRDNSVKSNELVDASIKNIDVLKETTQSISNLITELRDNFIKLTELVDVSKENIVALNKTTGYIRTLIEDQLHKEQKEKIKNSWIIQKDYSDDIKDIKSFIEKESSKLIEIDKKLKIRKTKLEKIKNSQKRNEFLKNKKK